jgi:Tol biopolymer transport system component
MQGSVSPASSGNYVLRVPVDGTLVSWSYRNGSNSFVGDSYSLRLLRPTNSNETSFTALATSTAPALPDADDQVRGPFGVSVPVKAGDRIGLRSSSGNNVSGVPVYNTGQSDEVRYFAPDIADGSTGTPQSAGNTGQQVLVQATIQYDDGGGGSPPPPSPGCPPTCPPTLGPATNGRIAFQSDRAGPDRSEIYTIYPDGSNLTQLTNNPGSLAHQPAFSPDGSKIAFTSTPRGSFKSDIYVMNADGTNQRRLTYTGDTGWPAFSPDGARIAFVRHVPGQDIFVMNADGTNQSRLTNAPGSWDPAFSPDGSKIAFTSDRSPHCCTQDVYVMNADGTNQRRLTSSPVDDFSPAFSPDGSKIAYTGRPIDGAFNVYLMNADGANQTRLTSYPNGSRATFPAFSPDGSKIAFFSQRPGNNGIYVMNADGTTQRKVTGHGGDFFPSWQPLRATPRLASYVLTPYSFYAASGGPPVTVSRRKRRGTRVRFRLNEDARVRFRVQKPLRGRRGRRGRCVKPTRKNRHRRRCTRYKSLRGSFTYKGHIGRNRFRFTGRLRRRKLKPGRYVLAGRPKAAGKTGKLRRVRFRVKRRPRR